MSDLGIGLSRVPPLGSLSFKPCSSSGVVITKMIKSTNARSSSGVILISLQVTNELRWEKRRMFLSGYQHIILEKFVFHFRDQLLGEIIELDREHAQVVDQPVVAEHRGDGHKQAGDGRDEGRRYAGRHRRHG